MTLSEVIVFASKNMRRIICWLLWPTSVIIYHTLASAQLS